MYEEIESAFTGRISQRLLYLYSEVILDFEEMNKESLELFAKFLESIVINT